MNQNLIAYEKRISEMIFCPETENLLSPSDTEGIFSFFLREYNLSPNETKTAWLLTTTFNYLLEIELPLWDREELIGKSSRQSIYDGLKEDWHRVYDGIDLIPMSDKELEERLEEQKKSGDYKYDFTNEAYYEDAWKIVKAYFCGRTKISRGIYEKISKIIECNLSQKNPMYRFEGPLMEEMKYLNEMKKMSREPSELYTYDTMLYGAPIGLGETTQKTKGWKEYSQVEGFESAFHQFVEEFKKARKELFEQKMKEYRESGNTTSKLILLNKTDNFAETIEILENM